MLLLILGALDIFAASLLLFAGVFPEIAYLMGIIILFKGRFSVIGAAAGGYFFDIMGWIDLIAGMCLCFGISIPFIWLILFLKGVFSILSGIGN
jgi:hypothetical protein